MKYSLCAAYLFLFFYLSFNHSFAQKKDPFELTLTKEAILITSGAAAGVTALSIMLNMNQLSIDEINALNPLDVNKFDRIAIGAFQRDYLGDAMLYSSYFMPLTFLVNDDSRKDFGNLLIMYGQVLLINASINGIVKGLTKRVRPFAYDKQSSLEEKATVNARLSFYSGHVSIAASNSIFTASVLNEYLNDNTTKTLIWTAAFLYPAIVGYSRVNTHQHFPTDVIVGYIVGAAIGYLIPLIHKRDSETENNSTFTNGNLHKPIIGFRLSF
ncbi:MAG: phosphatase PAP2 family protein [Ignavibacteria bacterium]|nr:phosphatase PAP2 family protein [Ignavibacteria bacterium]MBT8380727.1 phosphatase PAP2 family protein [Ignavibacteria bacterium]MBT8390470.1 phosphatase PAP2 family protein [Ignavibacteria bacterium]NNJ52910.1 phosphatase PAP2 family protein [Ignavibacteriaceae bacterium]NNL20065.1 phosphatase PAP2 family protein [Ignavibacteriaceae bacterium]